MSVHQSSTNFGIGRGRDCGWSHHFPIVDILIRCGYISDRRAKLSEIAPNFGRFVLTPFSQEGSQILGLVLNLHYFRSRGKVSQRLAEGPRRFRAEIMKKHQQRDMIGPWGSSAEPSCITALLTSPHSLQSRTGVRMDRASLPVGAKRFAERSCVSRKCFALIIIILYTVFQKSGTPSSYR